jgi:hypothetical protein
MSDEAEHDLSGQWTGVYSYPSRFPPNSFEAVLRDAAGSLTGTTTERDGVFGGDRLLHAVIDGQRDGTSVRFLKMYDQGDEAYDVVQYRGRVTDGGAEISGTWEVPGRWQGSFLMVRGPRAGASIARRVTEKIEL